MAGLGITNAIHSMGMSLSDFTMFASTQNGVDLLATQLTNHGYHARVFITFAYPAQY
jgi:hypothetical protein